MKLPYQYYNKILFYHPVQTGPQFFSLMDKTHFCGELIQIKPLHKSCRTVHISCTENCKTKFFFFYKRFVPLGAQVMINLQIEDQSQKDLDIVQ